MRRIRKENLSKTYNLGTQPGSIRALDDRMIEIVWITFVLILQFVKEVENVKAERGRGAVNGCWEPTCTEKLDMFGRSIRTIAITDDKTVNARQIKHHEVSKGGGGTFGRNIVANVDNKASCSE